MAVLEMLVQALWMHSLAVKSPSAAICDCALDFGPIAIEWMLGWPPISSVPHIDAVPLYALLALRLCVWSSIECWLWPMVSMVWKPAHRAAAIALRSLPAVCFVCRKSVHESLMVMRLHLDLYCTNCTENLDLHFVFQPPPAELYGERERKNEENTKSIWLNRHLFGFRNWTYSWW